MAPTKSTAAATVLLLACTAAMARTGAAQGSQALSYSSYSTASGCPTLPSCYRSGYYYIYDASGDVVFIPNSNACPSYLGITNTGSTEETGSMTLYDADGNSYGATYGSTLAVSLTAGCAVTFTPLSAPPSDVDKYGFASYTGGAACAPGACVQAGYNAVADATGAVAFLSASTADGCDGYFASVSAGGSSGSLVFQSVLANNVITPLNAGDITGSYSPTNVVVSRGGCSYTFNLATSSAAAPRAASAGAAALAVGAAVVAALL
jgi:hypothetical protein